MDPASLVSEAQDVAGDLHQIAVAVLNCNCQRNKNVECVIGCSFSLKPLVNSSP
jgi:hypothetical protein